MNFTAVRQAVRSTDLLRRMGKIEKIVSTTIEASGPEASIGDVCRIYKKAETALYTRKS